MGKQYNQHVDEKVVLNLLGRTPKSSMVSAWILQTVKYM